MKVSTILSIVTEWWIAKTFIIISDTNGTAIEKKGNKEIYNENVSTDNDFPIEEDEIVNLDPNEILINTVADSLSDAIKTEL